MITYTIKPKRGEVWYADFSPIKGSEQGGLRPCVIVSNDIGNAKSLVVIAVPITTAIKINLPTHYSIGYHKGIKGIALCEQVRTIDKARLKNKVTIFNDLMMSELDKCLKVALGL